jgi:multidrug efflux pump
MLALRVWLTTYVYWFLRLVARITRRRGSKAAQDWALRRAAKKIKAPEILWEDEVQPVADVKVDGTGLRAAE